MGHQSRARLEIQHARSERRASKTATIIHRKKLFGGRETAFEVHRRHAWGPRVCCYICGSRDVVVQLAYSMSPIDLVTREPRIAAVHIDQSESGMLPVWQSKYGPLVKFSVEYGCRQHAKGIEIDAAKLPSHILVEIDRGPEPDKTIVGVL